MWKEKLLGQKIDNLGQLAQRIAALNSQFQSMRRDTRFQKSTTVAEAYDPYSVDEGYDPWGRGVEESYDFDVTKSDKLFNFLLEKGQIKLPDGRHVAP